jgi:hypothetical protein
MADRGVLLIDWENLAGAILGRGKTVEAAHVSAIWDFANRRSGGHLQAHMAAAHFDASIDAQMSEHLIEREVVRSTKEQADILLTVLSMDYLNSGVRNFILVTGDQDFVPLITRLRRDNCRVVVVYGDPGRLSPELTRTLATAGVESIDIADLTQLKERKSDTSVRSLLGLLELTRKGYILGGRENGERVALLASWGIIENTEESQYWEVVSANTEKVTRQSAAARRGDKWLPASATRTYLALNSERVKEVFAADFLVRYLSSRPGGLGIAALRVGPFRGDGGQLLDGCLDALAATGLVREGADGRYAMMDGTMSLGYLEQPWRVYSAVQAETFKRSAASIPFGTLAPLLGRHGIGQGKDQRAAGLITESIRFAQAAGIVDTIAVDGKRHVTIGSSPLSKSIESAYRALYKSFSSRIDEDVPELEMLDFMEQMDAARSQPLFGYDIRDRHRVLRVLGQADLLRRSSSSVRLAESKWGEALVRQFR